MNLKSWYPRPQIRVFSNLGLIWPSFQKKKFRTGRRASTKMSSNLEFFSGHSFLGLCMRQCTHKHLQTSHGTQLEGPEILIILDAILF